MAACRDSETTSRDARVVELASSIWSERRLRTRRSPFRCPVDARSDRNARTGLTGTQWDVSSKTAPQPRQLQRRLPANIYQSTRSDSWMMRGLFDWRLKSCRPVVLFGATSFGWLKTLKKSADSRARTFSQIWTFL